MKYSIVIPTLNEKENIVSLIRCLEQAGIPDMEILVVDENSPDGTAAAVEEYAAGNERIRAIRNDGIPGLSPSIVKGFSSARGDLLCCMDGDLQHSPEDVIKLLAAAEHADMVIGSRYINGGGFAARWSLSRTIISKTAAAMARWLLQIRLSDPMSGFFVVRRSVFLREKHRLEPRGFKIMLELYYILQCSAQDYFCTECGITFGLRQHGHSKLGLRLIFQYLQQLISLRRRCRGKSIHE